MKEDFVKKKISQFLDHYPVGILSTIDTSKNAPESAVIGFAHTQKLELIFGTSNTTRKYANLAINPQVSFVTGWDSDHGTIQYEGIARELSPEEAQEYSTLLVNKNSESGKYISNADERFFLIKPLWIRFLDTAATPPHTYEIHL